MQKTIKISQLVNPHFKGLWTTDKPYILAKGGRGSFKSSTISLKLATMMKKYTQQNKQVNIVCFRENQSYLRDSVYNQILWALTMLDIQDEYKTYKAPLTIVHKKTNSTFYFYGADDPLKLKSNIVGNVIAIWYEECANMKSAEVFDQSNPTFIRQKADFVDQVKVFYSYNPPRNPFNWVNEWYAKQTHNEDFYVDTSTYLDDELGILDEQQLKLIETYKQNDPDYYKWLYLGEVIGLGNNVYNASLLQPIKELFVDDPIIMLAYSLDGGHSQSATTATLYGITAKNKVILLDTFYYSPQGKVNKLAPSELSKKIHDFILSQQEKPWGKLNIIKRTIDSAEGALRNQYYTDYGISWHPVAKKQKQIMIDSVYSLLASGRFYYLDTENNQIFVKQHQEYRYIEETLDTDEPKVIKENDHTCDAFQYFVLDNARLLGLKT